MQSLSEQEAMRVLQAAAAMDAMRAAGTRPAALAAASSWTSPMAATDDKPQTPSQALGDDMWKEMVEIEAGRQKRHGDLDSWLDVFRATASSVRSAWKTRTEGHSYEYLAFGWLALARKHETAPCVPLAAAAEEMPVVGSPLEQWRCEATWVQAAYLATSREHLGELLGLQSKDLLVYELDAGDQRHAYFIAVHHGSRSVRLVLRGSGYSRELLIGAAGPACALGQGYAHGSLLSAALSLLSAVTAPLREVLKEVLNTHRDYGVCFLGHSMGAGIAALMAILVNKVATAADGAQHAETATEWSALAAACPSKAVHATCFAPPPVVTVHLAEASVPYIDTVLYNADVVSRCSTVSLRRLANEVDAAKEEVMARNELAQVFRHSGTLANHLVAAALCRCQPPLEAGVAGLSVSPSVSATTVGVVPVAAPAGGGLPPPTRLIAAPEGLGGLLGRPSQPPAPPVVQCLPTNGRATQLASLTSNKPVTIAAGVNGGATTATGGASEGAATLRASDSYFPAVLATAAPVGPPSGTLPPLITPSSTANVRSGPGQDTPPRRTITDCPGVLSPPPLVLAAAAASAQAVSLVPTAAVSPTPPRRGLTAVSHDGRQPSALLAPLASQSDDGMLGSGGFKPRAEGPVPLPDTARPQPSLPVVLPPVASLPPVPLPMATSGAMRTGITAPGPVAEGMIGPDPSLLMQTTSPLQLPPMVLPPVSGPSIPSSTSPQATISLVTSTITGPSETVGRDWPLCTTTSELSQQLPQALLHGDLVSVSDKMPLPRHIAPLQPSIHVDSSAVLLPKQSMTQQHRPGGLLGDELVASTVGTQDQGAGGTGGPRGGMVAATVLKELLLPGCVYIIERRGADANATFRLLRDAGRTQMKRILLKRSMLRDHLMGHYLAALERALQQQQGSGGATAGTPTLSPVSTVDVPAGPSNAAAAALV